jgi:hypothetical protein
VLCEREREALDQVVVRHEDRKRRRVIAAVIGVIACVTTFALLLSVCDSGQ